GLEALDTLALSVLADDDELPPVLDRTVVVVPHPDAAKPSKDTEKGEDDSDYEVDGLPTIRPPSRRKPSVSPTPKASRKKGEHSGLTESEASEEEPSDAEPEDKPLDKTPKGKLYESSDDDEEEADSSTNDKAGKGAAATPGSSSGTKTPSPRDDKSSGKGHDKGRDKNPRKTP
ncbi:hypothetical protein PF011_g28243, partial [Phytophthora fragariae]